MYSIYIVHTYVHSLCTSLSACGGGGGGGGRWCVCVCVCARTHTHTCAHLHVRSIPLNTPFVVLEIRSKCSSIIILGQTISNLLRCMFGLVKDLITSLFVYQMSIRQCSAKRLTQSFLDQTKCQNGPTMSEC